MEKPCHILPFFIPETSAGERLDLREEVATIRGVSCTRKKVSPTVKMFICNKPIKEPVFYWEPVCKSSSFERGLELVKKGLGFPVDKEVGEGTGMARKRQKHRKNKC